MYEFLIRHREFLEKLIFNLARPLGYIKLPAHSGAFQAAMNVIRAAYWCPKIGKMGRHVQIESGVIICGNQKNLEIGDYSRISVNSVLKAGVPMKIGRHVHIAANNYIQSGGGEVIIGDFVGLSVGVSIHSSTNTYRTLEESGEARENTWLRSGSAEKGDVECGPVVIKDHAFLGDNCVILPGVCIGRGAMIGSGAVVTKDIPPYAIAVGMPAKVVKYRTIPQP